MLDNKRLTLREYLALQNAPQNGDCLLVGHVVLLADLPPREVDAERGRHEREFLRGRLLKDPHGRLLTDLRGR